MNSVVRPWSNIHAMEFFVPILNRRYHFQSYTSFYEEGPFSTKKVVRRSENNSPVSIGRAQLWKEFLCYFGRGHHDLYWARSITDTYPTNCIFYPLHIDTNFTTITCRLSLSHWTLSPLAIPFSKPEDSCPQTDGQTGRCYQAHYLPAWLS